MERKNVLIIGSGAREHAIGWKLSQSAGIGKLFFAPGNAGTARLGENLNYNLVDAQSKIWCYAFAKEYGIGLVVIGPDQALANGVADRFLEAGCRAFGPTKELAKIESSKASAKELMNLLEVPTPHWTTCHSIEGVKSALAKRDFFAVLKVNGLAAGKGVFISHDCQEALRWAENVFQDDAGPILVEERISGIEVSMLALCDGRSYVLCPPAVDYKRADKTNDMMTGGMGCVAPAPLISQEEWERIGERVIAPILNWLAGEEPRGFRGCLYAGLMLTHDGPQVLEYNARLGDPEAQAILPLLEDDLLTLFQQCADGRLRGRSGRLLPHRGYANCVVVADKDYPATSRSVISLPPTEELPLRDNLYVFQANTNFDKGGNPSSDGGRILSVVGVSDDPDSARLRAYSFLSHLQLPNTRWRTDIGENIPILP